LEPKNLALGIVIIGRNEGGRLVDCLQSLREHSSSIVYVDSASTDDSLLEAKTRNVHAVSLDMSKPFTAARARNTGFEYIKDVLPDLEYVQFVDGDCQVDANWLEGAVKFLQNHSDVAVVCGRRRERFPKSTIYNQMCDYEWDTPVGEAKACGGDALMRAGIFSSVGGFRESLIAGEEPELCVRIRAAGYKIWRLDAEMTLHDANMSHFKQWWKRTVRAGFAFAEGAFLHGAAPEFHWVAESRRALFWGLLLPLAIIVLIFVKPIWAILLLMVYPLQWLRLTLKNPQPFMQSGRLAFFLIVGKFAEAVGQIKFMLYRCTKKQTKIIEYK
jgi:GT2 family glycosyltransferase